MRETRRTFLKASAALGAGLVIDLAWPQAVGSRTVYAPNGFIRIDSAGAVTLVMPMVEMGQGSYTSMAMLLAEELEVGLDQVRVEHAPPNDALYANGLLHIQTTGLSSTIRAFWTPLRQAGAVARTLLVQAAAKQWGVEPDSCCAERGAVLHSASGRKARYGELAEAAAALPVPARESVALKHAKDFKLIGTAARRIDTLDKVNGRTQFGIDVKLPAMKVAAIAISPAFGGKPKSLNVAAARSVKGVRQIVRTDEAVAVVADHTWAAKKGLKAAAIQWDDGPNANVDNAAIVRELEVASQRAGAVGHNSGDVARALAGAAQRIDAVYQVPFLAHAAMEPMNCTVHARHDSIDIWVGTQAPTLTQIIVSKITGLPQDAIRVHNHYLGGGFGRRLDVDGTLHAVKVAQQVNGPVKVIWSREEDIQHDMYRPYYYDRLAAGLDASGKPIGWSHRIAGSSVMARYVPPLFKDGIDPDSVESAAETPYAFPNMHVDYVRVEPPGIPTAFWRGVGATHNVFVVESFLDELAHAANQDPLSYRRALITNPRALAVLNLAAEKAAWGQPLPKGRARGLSVQYAFGSYLAQVADVEVASDASVRVHRVICAIDCGMYVNPDTIAQQMEGGTVFGLTAALYGAITVSNGRVEQGNFNDYRPMRINESPIVETHLVKSAEAPGGIGEAPTAAIAPAVTNAIFAVTGKRIRTLPIDRALKGHV